MPLVVNWSISEPEGSPMEFASQEVTRAFEFDVSGLGPLAAGVLQILDCIEKDTIAVYNPDDEDAFQPVWNADESGQHPDRGI